MKSLTKIIVFIFLATTYCMTGSSQGILLRMMRGFDELAVSMVNFFSTTNTVDSAINRDKVRNMANEFYGEISELIAVKDSIVYTLEHSSSSTPNYQPFIVRLKDRTDSLSRLLEKYKKLLSATGTDAQKLSAKLKSDFMLKSATLSDARNTLGENGMSESEMKETLVVYFKSCINFLKEAQTAIEKYNAR